MKMKDGNVMTHARARHRAWRSRPAPRSTLKPGGYHIMFMELKRPLKEGEAVKGTLQFEKAGTVAVEFAVQGVGAREPAHKH